MTLSEAQRERWRAFVASGAPFAAYRQHNAPDARAETAEMLLAVAEHLAACERAMREFIRWGAMTGSDRDLFVGEFESLLAGRGSVYFTEPEVTP